MQIILNRKYTVLCLLFLLFYFLNSSYFWKAMYPVYFENEVKEAAAKYDVDPYLVYAIIQIESNFQRERRSEKGATGLMQLMPDTAMWIIQQGNLPPTMLDHLEHPTNNIYIGAWYISYLEKKFHHNHYAVVAAYNAGPGNVEKWMKENRWDGTSQNLSRIPFGETRHYVQRVLYFYGKYKSIYE
jgi:soluble lytic murein transglycosylase